MTTLRDAAQQALEALYTNYRGAEEAARILKAALAEPEKLPMVEIETVLTVQAEPVQEPVAWMDREGDLYKMPEIEGWAPPHTMLYTAPLNLNDPAVQKRLAAQWGYVKAEPTSCAYPNCLGGTVGTFCHDACIKKDGHARTTD